MKIGIDINGSNIKLGIVDCGIILKKIVQPFNVQKSEKETLDYLKGLIRQIMNSNIASIGIGVPSVVDATRGIVYSTTNIASCKKIHLKEILEKEFKIPVTVNNDCNCFAFGERYFGNGTAFHNLVCVTIGKGVGAGVIIEDKLYRGNNGAGEIGSLPYLNNDYEHYCSSYFFSKEYNTTVKEVSERARQGDKEAIRIWEEMGKHFGNLINAILYVYDPEAIILGGSLTQEFDLFSTKMYEVMDKFPYQETIKQLKVFVSQKQDIGLLGASALA